MVEFQPSKLVAWVRFPSPAPSVKNKKEVIIMVKKFKNVTVSISAFILIKLAMYSFIILLPLPEYLKCILISLGFMLSLFLVYLKPGYLKVLIPIQKKTHMIILQCLVFILFFICYLKSQILSPFSSENYH